LGFFFSLPSRKRRYPVPAPGPLDSFFFFPSPSRRVRRLRHQLPVRVPISLPVALSVMLLVACSWIVRPWSPSCPGHIHHRIDVDVAVVVHTVTMAAIATCTTRGDDVLTQRDVRRPTLVWWRKISPPCLWCSRRRDRPVRRKRDRNRGSRITLHPRGPSPGRRGRDRFVYIQRARPVVPHGWSPPLAAAGCRHRTLVVAARSALVAAAELSVPGHWRPWSASIRRVVILDRTVVARCRHRIRAETTRFFIALVVLGDKSILPPAEYAFSFSVQIAD